MATLTLADIQARISHRPPILLIDAVTAWQLGTSICATRHFKADDPLFAGHFPNDPILPGMLGIEAMAQSAALLVNLSRDMTAETTRFLFRGVENAKFKAPILPNTTITIHTELMTRKQDVYKFSGTCKIGETLCISGTFSALHQHGL